MTVYKIGWGVNMGGVPILQIWEVHQEDDTQTLLQTINISKSRGYMFVESEDMPDVVINSDPEI